MHRLVVWSLCVMHSERVMGPSGLANASLHTGEQISPRTGWALHPLVDVACNLERPSRFADSSWLANCLQLDERPVLSGLSL